MSQRLSHAIALVLVLVVGAACSTAAPNATASSTPQSTPTATPLPSVTSFEEYGLAFCAAWDALFQGVGNPDTGSGSVLSKALDTAVAAGDVASAERLAATITTTLETGRQQGAAAGRWPPAGAMMAHFDRVLVAFEAMVAAKVAKASQGATGVDPQAALEQAGGVEAWGAMFKAYGAIARPAGPSPQPCPTVPIAP